MSTLYEINQAIEIFEFEFDEFTGEVINESYLDQLQIDRDEKIEQIALYIKSLTADEKALKEESKALIERAKQKANKVEYLKSYLQHNLNGKKFETSKCCVSFRKATSVECPDEDAFARWCYDNGKENLINVKTTISPNKSEIKKAIKDGLECDYVGLAEKQSISIK